jgi:Fic family protein
MAGEYRTVEVDAFAPISDLPPHPSAVPGEMVRLGQELEQRSAVEPADAAEAVDMAIWAHMELVRIHPFQEGNGKTARLLMNVVLMRHVTTPTRPVDIPPSIRERYVMCVQEARQGRPEPFVALVADLLERMAEIEERRASFLPPWRRIRWRQRT